MVIGAETAGASQKLVGHLSVHGVSGLLHVVTPPGLVWVSSQHGSFRARLFEWQPKALKELLPLSQVKTTLFLKLGLKGHFNCSLGQDSHDSLPSFKGRGYNTYPTSQWEECWDGRQNCDHLWKYHLSQGDISVNVFHAISNIFIC